jgi:hypothetical protein
MEKVYMFVDDGHIQFWEEGGCSGMILAPTHELAQKFVDWNAKNHGRNLAMTEIGSASNGETLSTRLAASREAGATAAFIIDNIDQDEIEVLPIIPA